METIEHEFMGNRFKFEKTPQAQALVNEIFSDNYKIFASGITFPPGSIILDLGACEGMFSIMMAKTFPDCRVISFEPVPRTYAHLRSNIELNNVHNIETHNIGVCGSNDKAIDIEMSIGKNDYSGGSSMVMTYDPALHDKQIVTLTSIDNIFSDLGIDRVRFLKIDIEGMEYAALYNSHVLDRVDYMSGEFHMNRKLEYDGYRMDALANWCANRTRVVAIESCRMAE